MLPTGSPYIGSRFHSPALSAIIPSQEVERGTTVQPGTQQAQVPAGVSQGPAQTQQSATAGERESQRATRLSREAEYVPKSIQEMKEITDIG